MPTDNNLYDKLTVEELWRLREYARKIVAEVNEELADRFERVTNKSLASV